MSDRFHTGGTAVMTKAEAMAALKEKITPVTGTEQVPLREALGRVLAEDVVSDRDVPPYDNSAMDGYVVFFDDLKVEGETRMPVTGRIAAGHPLDREAKRGEALQIFTGALVPEGPDTVFTVEEVTRDGDTLILPPGARRRQHCRKRAEDVSVGDVVVPTGRLLRAQEVGMAASVGYAELTVLRKLRAAVFSTGDEIRDPGGDTPPGCIYDSNRFTVMALLNGVGCRVTDLGILPDDPGTVRDALEKAAPDHDLIITSGGVSMGEEDHIKDVVEDLGSLHFWKLAIKPGKPVALGQIGEAAFIGLPGNPVSAMVIFMIIGRAVTALLQGRSDVEPTRIPVPAATDWQGKTGRREWVRGRLGTDDNGRVVAEIYKTQGSGVLTSMVASEGLIEIPEDVDRIEVGQPVDYIPFTEMTR